MGDPTPDPTPTPIPTPPPPDPEKEQLIKLNAEQAKALALAQTRLDFPKANGELLAQFQGTPEAMRAFAEKLHAYELAREVKPSATSPTPAPGPGTGTTAEDAAIAHYNELRQKVLVYRNAEPWEREEFDNLAFARGWNQHQAERKAGRSSNA